jgi:hypothetical protein
VLYFSRRPTQNDAVYDTFVGGVSSGTAYGGTYNLTEGTRGAIHQFLNIILKLRILVLLPVLTLSYVVKVKNYS